MCIRDSCRAKADWLVGINASRLFSVLYNQNLKVGRVQTPTLAMIVDRNQKIKEFTKENYYMAHIKFDDMDAVTAVSYTHLDVYKRQVDINNRIVCFDIKELGKQLKKIGMLIVQDQVWNRVTINRSAHKSTRYYVDEFHLLLKEEQTAAYSVEIWKRFRKWGGIPTGELVCYLLVA